MSSRHIHKSDTQANIDGIEDFQAVAIRDRFTFFRIPKAIGVAHASLVLRDPIYSIDLTETD